VAADVLDQPVVDMVRDAHLGVLVEECQVPDGVKSFTEVQGSDNDKMVGGEDVGDGMQNSNESSCSGTRWVEGKLISE